MYKHLSVACIIGFHSSSFFRMDDTFLYTMHCGFLLGELCAKTFLCKSLQLDGNVNLRVPYCSFSSNLLGDERIPDSYAFLNIMNVIRVGF